MGRRRRRSPAPEREGHPAFALPTEIPALGLGHLAWTYAIAWAAIAALRGRLTMAAGELAISILAAGLVGIVLANPAGYMQGTTDTMSRLSGALLATGTGQPPPDGAGDAAAVMEPLQAEIHAAFVEAPYDHLNGGGPLPEPVGARREPRHRTPRSRRRAARFHEDGRL